MLWISSVAKVLSQRKNSYCPICQRTVRGEPSFQVYTSNTVIMTFLGGSSLPKKTCRIFWLHEQCLKKVRDKLEEIEREGYTPLCSDDEWEQVMD